MSRNGKGSKSRPYSVSYKTYCDNFDDIFRKKPKVKGFIINPNWTVKINIIPNDKDKQET
jgi:hypothetical protein